LPSKNLSKKVLQSGILKKKNSHETEKHFISSLTVLSLNDKNIDKIVTA